MSYRKMTVKEVISHILDDDSSDDFAFRGDNFEPVRKFRKSKYHGDNMPEYQLPGVSAVNIAAYRAEYIVKAIEEAKRYGKNVYLLKGETRNADDITGDPHEVIMMSHEIVCIVI